MKADGPEYSGGCVEKSPVFSTTRWSVILDAGDSRSPQHDEALAALCQGYWYPIYAFIRRQGSDPEDAKDLTQEFFRRLLEKNYLGRADPNRGRFRWFLLGAVRHFLSNDRQQRRALKRGGRSSHVSLDEIDAENRYHRTLSTHMTPEKIFERGWAIAVLERVRDRLRDSYKEAGKGSRIELLEFLMPGARTNLPYHDVAARLGLSEVALRSELHRLRKTYRQLLRREVAQTVAAPEQVQEELRHLIEIVQEC